MKLAIVIPAKNQQDPLVEASLAYQKKCQYPYMVTTTFIKSGFGLSDKFLSEKTKKQKQSFEKEQQNAFKVALDASGTLMSSEKFSDFLQSLGQKNVSRIMFMIGGASGLPKEVLAQADEIMSLSLMTMPHKMALLVLSEQIYRASEIFKNSPYHK